MKCGFSAKTGVIASKFAELCLKECLNNPAHTEQPPCTEIPNPPLDNYNSAEKLYSLKRSVSYIQERYNDLSMGVFVHRFLYTDCLSS